MNFNSNPIKQVKEIIIDLPTSASSQKPVKSTNTQKHLWMILYAKEHFVDHPQNINNKVIKVIPY